MASSPTIDLVYFDGCPHVDAARTLLHTTLAGLGRETTWREWSTDDPALPGYAAGYGSPSIFVAGREVTGEPPSDSPACCRRYEAGPFGERGTPSAERVAAAIREADR